MSSRPANVPTELTWELTENHVSEPEAATSARATARELGVAPLSRGTAAALTFLAAAVRAKAVVEVGTGSGVSGLALFAGMQPDGVLTSVDIEPEHQAAARETFTSSGIASQRFRLISGPALSVLPKLRGDAYDLVFIDGDKAEYPAYLTEAVRLLQTGGVLAIDNTTWHNQAADKSVSDPDTEAIRETIAAVRDAHNLVDAHFSIGDGLLVAVKR